MPDDGYSIKDRASYFIKTRAWNIISECGIINPPIMAAQVASKLGINVSETYLDGASGLLEPTEKGLQIKLNAEEIQVRKNFSCAHELMHTYFLDGKGRSFIETVMKIDGFNAARNLEERLCNTGAAELLMPRDMFKQAANKLRFSVASSVASIEPLAKMFSCSVDATSIRVAELSPAPCTRIRWKIANGTPEEPTAFRIEHSTEFKLESPPKAYPEALRLRSTKGILRSKFYKPKMDASEAVFRAYSGEGVVRSDERLRTNTVSIPCYVESKGFSRVPWRNVISLAFPKGLL
ncbi:MAG: ImmA/IrrE family metallo-endopeptidase [Dehalococcoidia bacterium]|nr:ImmA/IrrE family metallo-endopeptidase [Dehalococcoidia bacterium]